MRLDGHAIECRINAEDPRAGFRPTPGRIEKWTVPQGAGVRVDTYAHDGAVVAPWYDSLVAKVIVHAPDRPAAVDLMRRTLARTRAEGISTTVDVHRAILDDPAFAEAPVTTRWLEEQFLPSWLDD
ncbi:hypothetical protein [Amycolatopsis methanolica]|uniref:hypothetical protein n=1 Tax=Amycolatopsis methanolica TaxID=1814 RepID=UPI003F4D7693